MKILLVGPGNMEIPNDGWGAIEIIIWQFKLHLEALGHKVDILNKKGRKAALEAEPWKYDFVHLHYDRYVRLWGELSKKHLFKLLVTTYFAHTGNPEKWNDAYKANFKDLLEIDNLLVVSPVIKNAYQKMGHKGKIEVLPSGTETSQINFSQKGNGKAICLGKIQKRKRQALLSTFINRHGNIECDFAGPIEDKTFDPDNKHTHYLGHWTREQVHQNLTNYSCLVLPSTGEAHPLVVMEGLSAGLSVVVTPEASANLDSSLPFIYIENFNDSFIEKIKHACEDNYKYRDQIRKYAKDNFSWETITKRYVELLKNKF